ncbi:response regulator [Tsukamurella tyrosinosolvens]|uniref:response regulator n=1 Tax=Tsukamurella tyrosinosolvens TaxID=57704 RepID=UPI000C7F5F02|nr:response regulator transcription factor [Tsukamurella tyrosinosolvens]
MTQVFLVDDHEIARRGIAQLIAAEPGLEVVGESATVRGTLGRVVASMPDVVVLDVHLPDGNGVDLCRSIRSTRSDIRCLVLTGDDDDTAAAAAVIAGASGYVLKTIRGRALIDGIHRVARGESLTPQHVTDRVHATLAAKIRHPRPPQAALTLRERQALQLITEGLTNRQIGERLGIAEKTVKNYVSGLLAKLGMQRRTQVAAYGAAHETPSNRYQPGDLPPNAER